jgi:hypothetical protein
VETHELREDDTWNGISVICTSCLAQTTVPTTEEYSPQCAGP